MSDSIKELDRNEALDMIEKHILAANKLASIYNVDFACAVSLEEGRLINSTNGESLKVIGLISILKQVTIEQLR